MLSEEKRDNVNITVREYKSGDAHVAAEIWNEVVRDGVAFPQEEPLTFLRTILKAEPCENS